MPLTICPQHPLNTFEHAVADTLTTLAPHVSHGYFANQILLSDDTPRCNPNEHDIVLLLPWGGYTLDAKAFSPGYYEIPFNAKCRYRPNDPNFHLTDGQTQVGKFRNPFLVSKTKASILYSNFSRGNPTLAQNRYRIESLIVIPDHAVLVAPAAATHSVGGLTINLRVVNLSSLVSVILNDGNSWGTGVTPAADADLHTVFQKLQALPTTIALDTVISDVRLEYVLVSAEIGCPVPLTAFAGEFIPSRTAVEARFYQKWPWSAETKRFLEHAERRLHALHAADVRGIARVIHVDMQPDFLMVAYRRFQGETLGELLGRGPLPRELACDVIRNLADTVFNLHDQLHHQVIHHDIRPEHVLIGPNLDQHRGRDHVLMGFTNPMMDNQSLSTAVFNDKYESSFAAPELQESKHPDRDLPQGDIFSLGRLALYCLLGDQEYRTRAVARRSAEAPFDFSGIDAALAREIERATDFYARNRHPSARDFRNAL